ncbi:type IV pilus assembly protein PilY1 [Methylomagnum ishizawai]|uniref:Type IV pilus assembly protein PilY1 n=1 Tax=Methylomagnum ishizawai TaxID=1760988 RepID=A0A1Y6D3I6_9GAMM|nr:PilC/PilY family type IV pilus protein [Methylomagnum ishizawai]SMF95403.1 type IV pilus assembly protein PilY1 [Methylomagnum ishizawai]
MNIRRLLGKLVWACVCLLFAVMVQAGTTDLANAPLVTSASTSVKPNLWFILDDSGSMAWDYMGDWVGGADNGVKVCKGGSTGAANSSYCCQSSAGGSSPNSSSNACWKGSSSSTPSSSFGGFRGEPLFLTNDADGVANGVYYNPAIFYKVPVVYQDSNSGAEDTGKYVSQTSANTSGWTKVKNDGYDVQWSSTDTINLITQFPDLEWCTTTSYTDCLRNDNYILPTSVKINDKTYNVFHAANATGSGSVVSGDPDNPTVSARTFGPHYYTITPGEYCDSKNLRNCQAAQDVTFQFPAKLRWCSDSALTNCQAIKTPTFKYPRFPTNGMSTGGTAGKDAVPASVTFAVSMPNCSSSKKATISQVLINGTNVLVSPTTTPQNSATSLAADLRNASYTSNYTIDTSVTSSKVKINVDLSLGSAGNISSVSIVKTPNSNTCNPSAISVTYTPYSPAVPAVPKTWYGGFYRTDIVPGQTYPVNGVKPATRTDCAAATYCTYDEEMTNFANWWAYYHTRMQMMKSSASLAFQPIGQNYRVGFFTINASAVKTGTEFLNISDFDFSGTTKQKYTWYSKLFSTGPSGSTPLRGALTKAGRLYAKQISGAADPVQYSCQQNFTLLSTDGYWNESEPGGYQLNGSTEVGDQDGSEQRPMLDGNNQANTLADVAEYYYVTDLRTTGLGNCTGVPVPPATTGNTLCSSESPDPYDNVPTGGSDTSAKQHMTTFTLGLGASGYMQFDPGSSYQTQTSGDFFDVSNGTTPNSKAGICSWQSSGSECNWPPTSNNSQPNIDDLWHAAVNGRGSYFSATNPASLATGLQRALAGVTARNGAAAAATTSNPNVSSGDDFVFSSIYTTVQWSGELVRQRIDLDTGAVVKYDPEDPSTYDWVARSILDATPYTSRNIYTKTSAGLQPFTWGSLDATTQSYFSLPYISTTPPTGFNTLSQICTVGTDCIDVSLQDNDHVGGQNLVSFLRGDRSNEGSESDSSKYYRQRAHVLGDLVNAEAVYVRGSLFKYADSGYSDFKDANDKGRLPVVYVAANDGMLHAFNGGDTASGGGTEKWAYIPSFLLPKLYALADKQYYLGDNHRFFADATPVVGDIACPASGCVTSSGGVSGWRTILVGGLNSGGRGYYALDVTNPASTPTLLWEFTDPNMGYTFGNPQITKLTDGTWVVLVTSGYNNVSPGDGKGRLYVINAATGALIRSIATTAGSTTTPSGLGRISTWVNSPAYDNTATAVYGGDLMGNLWRFDPNSAQGVNNPVLLATFKNPSGNAQPITTKPELGDVDGNHVVYVGTGRYLGATDLNDKSVQTFYAVKDPLDNTGYGNPRTAGGFVQQVMTTTTCPAGTSSEVCGSNQTVRIITSNAVDLASANSGWYIDLPDSGERSNTDPTLVFGVLVFTTNVPTTDACSSGGYSYHYLLDYRTGSSLLAVGTGVAAVKAANALATREVVVALPNGKVVSLTRFSDLSNENRAVPLGGKLGPARRVSWRELITNQ